MKFAEECGAIDHGRRERLADDCWKALLFASAAQAKHHTAAEPTSQFLAQLRACLSSGKAHLRARQGAAPDRAQESCGWRNDAKGNWTAFGDCVGWLDGDDIYLDPEAAYRIVQLASRDSGEAFSMSLQTLNKRLREKGLLASTDRKRETLTVRRSIGGSAKDVLHLSRVTLMPEAPDDEE